ncbi:hypothetical protein ACHAWF_017472 [Thalassiosira exigua]
MLSSLAARRLRRPSPPTPTSVRRVRRALASSSSSAARGRGRVGDELDDDEQEGREGHVHDALIAGGGPTGLLLSTLLSSHGAKDHLVFDARPSDELLRHPQAHYVNARSAEILRGEAPRAYSGVTKAAPPAEEWKGFNFGGSVSNSGGRRLGRVVHPVTEPLRVGQRGDAVLVPNDGRDEAHDTATEDAAPYATACRPAHLAQNKFAKLLLDEARRRFDDGRDDDGEAASEEPDADGRGRARPCGDRLRYGEAVVHLAESPPSSAEPTEPIVTIRTSNGRTYRGRYLLACDGVRSFVRNRLDVPMAGDDRVQELVNVHFRTNSKLSEWLMRRSARSGGDEGREGGGDDRAMLHFVYNSNLVGCFVCHDGSEGEWALQMPYFPPYQTVEEDFSERKVRDMIWAGLGVRREGGGDEEEAASEDGYGIDVLSIRPWTMSSLIAREYHSESKRIFLAGDAAHAFPPAGGFGMNTGLQDAHNLAWRVALALRWEKGKGSEGASRASTMLAQYDLERRPIAAQNAALSVRNYQRTLEVAKACYLDARHPALLLQVLNAPPTNLLPLEVRREMFRGLVKAATMPLGSLTARDPSGGTRWDRAHADRVEENVRSILERGGSLPLVFPKYELGFSYGSEEDGGDDATEEDQGDGRDDAGAYFPTLRAGHRMPHVEVEILPRIDDGEGRGGLEPLDRLDLRLDAGDDDDAAARGGSMRVALADVPLLSRRTHPDEPPRFALVAVGPGPTSPAARAADEARSAAEGWDVPMMLINVLPSIDELKRRRRDVQRRGHDDFEEVGVADPRGALQKLVRDELGPSKGDGANASGGEIDALIVIRPDGHIADAARIDADDREEELSTRIRGAIERGLRRALGDVGPPRD